MISTIRSWKGLNIDNKLQMCVSLDTNVGDRVKRMTADERATDRAGNVQSEIHPDHPFLVKLDIQYFILIIHHKVLDVNIQIRSQYLFYNKYRVFNKIRYGTIDFIIRCRNL